MNIIVLLIPIAILLAATFVTAFIWSARKGQYDDLDTPAMRIIFDDETNKSVKGKKS